VSAAAVWLDKEMVLVVHQSELQNPVLNAWHNSSASTLEVHFLVTKMFHLKLDVVESCAKKEKEQQADTSKLYKDTFPSCLIFIPHATKILKEHLHININLKIDLTQVFHPPNLTFLTDEMMHMFVM